MPPPRRRDSPATPRMRASSRRRPVPARCRRRITRREGNDRPASRSPRYAGPPRKADGGERTRFAKRATAPRAKGRRTRRWRPPPPGDRRPRLAIQTLEQCQQLRGPVLGRDHRPKAPADDRPHLTQTHGTGPRTSEAGGGGWAPPVEAEWGLGRDRGACDSRPAWPRTSLRRDRAPVARSLGREPVTLGA